MCLLIQASLQLCRKDVVFEEFLPSVFSVCFFPNGHRSSWLAKVEWDRNIKFCTQAYPGKHRHQIVCAVLGFLIPRKLHVHLLTLTCTKSVEENMLERMRVLTTARYRKPLHTAKHAEDCTEEQHRRRREKQQWIKLCSLTGEVLQGTVFEHHIWFLAACDALLEVVLGWERK